MEYKKKTAPEVPVQEQLNATIKVSDKDLLKNKLNTIRVLINFLEAELKSLPDMFEVKI